MKISKWFLILIPVIIVCVTILFYWSSLFYPFQFDDNLAILKQFAIRKADLFAHFFNNSRWVGNWLNALDFSIGRFDPMVYRVTNLVIHLGATLAVFYLFYYLFSLKDTKSFVGANRLFLSSTISILFSLHPVQTQTVSYIIQGRLEGLSALFILLALIGFVAMTQVKQWAIKGGCFFAILFFLFLAGGTKEISIVAPILILLVDWFFVARGTWGALCKRIPFYGVIFTFVGAIYLYFMRQFIFKVLTFNVEIYNNVGNVLTESVTDQIRTWPFLLSQFKVILHYILIFIFPFNISAEYDWKLVSGFFASDCLLPLTVLIALAAVIVYVLKHDKISLIGFGALWFIVCILPRSSIVPSGELLADYKTYLASIGIFVILGIGCVHGALWLAALARRKGMNPRVIIAMLTVLLTLVLGTLTWRQNKVWESDLVFWSDIIAHAPRKARAHNNYGIALIKAERFKESIPYFKKALNLQQGSYWDPYTNLSIAYSSLGKVDLAIEAIKQALKINRYHPESYNSLGLLFMQKQRYDDAQKSFEVAVTLRPHYGKARFNLGNVFIKKQDLEHAWQCYRDCCIHDDFDTVPDGFARYASLSMHLNKRDDAIVGYTKLAQQFPDYPDALLNAGNAYYFNEQFDRALPYYQEAAQRVPNDFRPLANVAQTYLKLGRVEEALEVLKQARTMEHAPLELELKVAHCFELMGEKKIARHLLQQLAEQKNDIGVQEKARVLLSDAE